MMKLQFSATAISAIIGRHAGAVITLALLLLQGCGAGSASDDRRLVGRWVEQACTAEDDSLIMEIRERGGILEPYFIEVIINDLVPEPTGNGDRIYQQCLRAYLRLRATRLPPDASIAFQRIMARHAVGEWGIRPQPHRRAERALMGLAIGGGPSVEPLLAHFREYGPMELRPTAANATTILHRYQRRSSQ